MSKRKPAIYVSLDAGSLWLRCGRQILWAKTLCLLPSANSKPFKIPTKHAVDFRHAVRRVLTVRAAWMQETPYWEGHEYVLPGVSSVARHLQWVRHQAYRAHIAKDYGWRGGEE